MSSLSWRVGRSQRSSPPSGTPRSVGSTAYFYKEDVAKDLLDHSAKTQDMLADTTDDAEVAETKRAVFSALTRLRAATIKECAGKKLAS